MDKPQERKTIKITLMKGMIGVIQSHKDTVRALGLHRRHHTVERVDTPEIRGMINAIRYMVKVTE